MNPHDPAPTARAPRATLLCLAVSLAGLAGLVAMVVLHGGPFWWDESWYLGSVPELHRLGLGRPFLRGLPGPAGPLYACVHYLLEPITGLRPLPTRLANVGLFLLTAAALGGAMRAAGVAWPMLRAPALLAAPVMFGATGTALTELPAMLGFCLGLALLLAALAPASGSAMAAGAPPRPLPTRLAPAVGAGLCFGLAVAGRQQYLMAIPAAAALLTGPGADRRTGLPVLLAYWATAAILPAILFATWGGASPPHTGYVGDGFSPVHLVLSFAYAGVMYCIYDVSWLARRRRLLAGLVLVATAANLATGAFEHVPMLETARRHLPARVLPYYARAGCGLMLGFGLAFMECLARRAIAGDGLRRYLALASALLLTTPAKITHMFAGRYTAAALPLLMIMAYQDSADTPGRAARMALGCALGLVSLYAFLS